MSYFLKVQSFISAGHQVQLPKNLKRWTENVGFEQSNFPFTLFSV